MSKSQEAYIRDNLRTLFGRKKACQNIGRNHVNFPEIYDGKRQDLSRALLNLIKKADPSYRVHSDSVETNVMTGIIQTALHITKLVLEIVEQLNISTTTLLIFNLN